MDCPSSLQHLNYLCIHQLSAYKMVRLSLHTGQVAYQAGAFPGFCSMKCLGVFPLTPGTLVHRRITSIFKLAGTHLYIWVQRGSVRVNCLSQEHNTIFPVRTPTRTARSGDECTNQEATAHGSVY